MNGNTVVPFLLCYSHAKEVSQEKGSTRTRGPTISKNYSQSLKPAPFFLVVVPHHPLNGQTKPAEIQIKY